ILVQTVAAIALLWLLGRRRGAELAAGAAAGPAWWAAPAGGAPPAPTAPPGGPGAFARRPGSVPAWCERPRGPVGGRAAPGRARRGGPAPRAGGGRVRVSRSPTSSG